MHYFHIWVGSEQNTTQKQPETKFSAATKRCWTTKPISMKLAWYMYHVNTFRLLKTEGANPKVAEGASKKPPKNSSQNRDFNNT